MTTATAIRSQTFNRVTKARKLAEVLDWTLGDARVATDNEWFHALKWAHVNTPSAATKAAVVALMDVAAGRLQERLTNVSGDEHKAYLTARKAAVMVTAFEAAGLAADAEPTQEQWDLANRISAALTGVKKVAPVSDPVRDAVAALRA